MLPDPIFRREGDDILLDLPVTLQEAVLGARVEVPTIAGPVTLAIPPRSANGARLRLRGRGIREGHQYVVLTLVLPDGAQTDDARWIGSHPERPVLVSVSLLSGAWEEPDTGRTGRDLVSLVAHLFGLSQAQAARRLAADTGAIVVLKGSGTLVAAPDGRIAVIPTGDARLATAQARSDTASAVADLKAAAGTTHFPDARP